MWQTLLSLFSDKSVIDRGMGVIEHLTGADDITAKEKADFLIEYHKVTRHQSSSRRVIALLVAFTWVSMVSVWLLGSVLNVWLEMDSLRMMVNTVKIFMKDIVLQPFNLVIGFYFAVHGVKALSK